MWGSHSLTGATTNIVSALVLSTRLTGRAVAGVHGEIVIHHLRLPDIRKQWVFTARKWNDRMKLARACDKTTPCGKES